MTKRKARNDDACCEAWYHAGHERVRAVARYLLSRTEIAEHYQMCPEATFTLRGRPMNTALAIHGSLAIGFVDAICSCCKYTIFEVAEIGISCPRCASTNKPHDIVFSKRDFDGITSLMLQNVPLP